MSPYRRCKSFVAVLSVLMTCTTGAKGVVLPTMDNYADESVIVRQPSVESEAAPDEQEENMMASPAVVYYLKMIRNRIRQPTGLFRKGLQPQSYQTSSPLAALMRELQSEGRYNKISRRRGGSSLARAMDLIRRRAAAVAALGVARVIDHESSADQPDYLRRKDGVDCDGALRRLDARCRSLLVNPEEEEDLVEQKDKRREFVIDLGKRFDDFRADLGK